MYGHSARVVQPTCKNARTCVYLRQVRGFPLLSSRRRPREGLRLRRRPRAAESGRQLVGHRRSPLPRHCKAPALEIFHQAAGLQLRVARLAQHQVGVPLFLGQRLSRRQVLRLPGGRRLLTIKPAQGMLRAAASRKINTPQAAGCRKDRQDRRCRRKACSERQQVQLIRAEHYTQKSTSTLTSILCGPLN